MPSSTVIKETEKKQQPKKSSQDSFPLNPEALRKQKIMLKNMSTGLLQAKWCYLKNCYVQKNQARTLARSVEKELIRRGILVEDDDESTLTEGSWCGE